MRSETEKQQSRELGQAGIADGTPENVQALILHDLDVKAEEARRRERDSGNSRLPVIRSSSPPLGQYIRKGGIAGAVLALLLVFLQPVPGDVVTTLLAGAAIGAMLGCALFVAGRLLEWTVAVLAVLVKAAVGVLVLVFIAAMLGIV